MSVPAPLPQSIVLRLYELARAERWDLSHDRFQTALEASCAHRFGDARPGEDAVETYVATLHVEDLALACACADGHDAAWSHFILEHRPVLYRAADAIDPTGGARELADALYADLFGLRERAGARQSLFRYFHGRSRLSTWLRAVLSQRHIDHIRTTVRLAPLPEEESELAAPSRGSATETDPERSRFFAAMRRALSAAVAALPPRDRLRLGCYYAQDLTLAVIGRMLGEHEATVSRHLTRTRRTIRETVEQRLRDESGFSDAEIAECFRSVVDDPGSLDLADMVGPASTALGAGPSTSLGAGPSTSLRAGPSTSLRAGKKRAEDRSS